MPAMPVLAPAVGARTRLIVREVVPRVPAGAVVLAHRSPLALAQVRTPGLPWRLAGARVLQPPVLWGGSNSGRGHLEECSRRPWARQSCSPPCLGHAHPCRRPRQLDDRQGRRGAPDAADAGVGCGSWTCLRPACSRRMADLGVDGASRGVSAWRARAVRRSGDDSHLLDAGADGAVLPSRRGAGGVPSGSGDRAGRTELGVPASVRRTGLDPAARRGRTPARAPAHAGAVPRRPHACHRADDRRARPAGAGTGAAGSSRCSARGG